MHKYARIFSRGAPAFHGGVGRNMPGTLPVSTPPRAPVYPSGYTTCRPYHRLSRCCTYTACTFDCTPSRRGGGARPRCRQGEPSPKGGPGLHAPDRSPANMFALRRSPGGGSYRGPGGVLRAGGPPPRSQVAQCRDSRQRVPSPRPGARALMRVISAAPVHGITPPRRGRSRLGCSAQCRAAAARSAPPAETSHPTAFAEA